MYDHYEYFLQIEKRPRSPYKFSSNSNFSTRSDLSFLGSAIDLGSKARCSFYRGAQCNNENDLNTCRDLHHSNASDGESYIEHADDETVIERWEDTCSNEENHKESLGKAHPKAIVVVLVEDVNPL